MIRRATLAAIDILLVKDSPSDALLTKEALASGKLINRVHLIEDREKVIAFPRNEPPYADAPHPHLILLELNMPRMDGREALSVIKADEDLMVIPAIVLTTSNAELDNPRSCKLPANRHATNPVGFDP